MRRAAALIAAAAVIVSMAFIPISPASAVGATIPSAPRRVMTYPGIDGVRLYWTAPTDVGGGLNGYDVYRTGADAVTSKLGSTAAGVREYFDPVGVGDWTYTVKAVNDAGESADSNAAATAVAAPVPAGVQDALTLDNSARRAYVAPVDSVRVAPTPGNQVFFVSGSSTASSPQGAASDSVAVGSMANGKRVVAGTTYQTSNFTDGFGPTAYLNPTCGGLALGTLTVSEASFQSDGTPLVFAADFTSTCNSVPSYGSVRWHAHSGIQAVTSNPARVSMGNRASGVKSDPSTVMLINPGTADQPLGQASLTGASAAQFAIDTDTCSGTTLAAGRTCTISVSTTPAPGYGNALLVVPTQTPRGQWQAVVEATGIAKPIAPMLSATSFLHTLTLHWQNVAGATEAGHTIYRGTSASQLSTLATLPSGQPMSMSYTDTTAVPGTTYYYAVSASNLAGEGALSSTVSATADTTAVVFTTDAYLGNGYFQIAMSAGTGTMRQLTSDAGDHDTPAVSPDGTRVAYTSNHGNGVSDYDVWVQDLAGGAPTRVTSGSNTADGAPAWSPDGRYLAFVRFPAAGGVPSIWVVPAAGGTATQVPGTAGEFDPSWSPSARLLAVSHVAGGTSSVVVTSLDGTYRRVVTGTNDVGTSGSDPSWSPDGRAFAFVRSGADGDHLATVPATGGVATILAPAFGDVAAPTWNPATGRIVFERDTSVWNSSLWSVDPRTSGSEVQVPTEGGRANMWPSVLAPPVAYSPASKPIQPVWQAATLGSHTSRLSWVAPPGTAYVVVRRSAPNGPAPASPEDGVAIYSGTASTAVASDLSYQTVYRFSAFAVSPLGDASQPAVWSMRNAAVPGTRPNGSGSVLTSLYRGGPAFVASWSGSPLPGQVFDVQIGVRRLGRTGWTGPVWSNLVIGTRSTSKVVAASAGTTYYLRARIRDDSGNVTPWSTPTVVPVPYDDRALAATGRWSSQSRQPGRFASTVRASSSAGASLSLTTYGTSFAVVADRCAVCGQFRIYVDGVYKGSVDTYSRTTRTRQVVWASRPSSLRKHRITVVVVGTPRRPAVRIDGMIASR